MATTIKLKSGSGAPLAGDLVAAEPAFDLTNKRLYTEDSGGTVIEVGTNPTSLTTGTFTSTGIDDNATSTAITIDASENVGIGTASPVTAFEVEGSGTELIRVSSTSGNSGSVAGTGSLGLDFFSGSTHPAVLLSAHEDSVATYLSEFSISLRASNADTTPTERMRIDSSGNVGIGTASPSSTLHLYGTGSPIRLNIEGTTGRVESRLDNTSGAFIFGIDDSGGAGFGSAYSRNIYSNGAYPMLFWTNNAERMRIDSSGRVGIGVSSPAEMLDINEGSTATYIRMRNATSTTGYIGYGTGASATDMTFWTDGTKQVTIDGSGRVGIGTTSPAEELHVETSGGDTAGIQLSTTGGTVERDWKFLATSAAGTLFIQDATASANRIAVDTSGNVGIGTTSPTHDLTVGSTSASDYVIALRGGVGGFFGWDDSANTTIVQAPNTRSLSFQVNSDTFSAGTEAMRIDSSGKVLIAKSSSGLSTAGFEFNPLGLQYITRSGGTALGINRTGSDGGSVAFYRSGTTVGTISVTSSATSYNTSSDVRLKENIVDAPAGNIDAIRVRSFDWKADGSHQTYGMVAQELVDIAPEAVSQGETDDDMWGVDYSKLVPMMIKEIQDLKAEVAALKGA